MKTALRVAVSIAGLLVSAVLLAAEHPGCAGVKFSEEVLGRFPRAPEACLDVITKDGQQFGVFKAELLSVRGNSVRVRVRMPDGSYSAAQSIRTRPDLRVLIDGKPARLSEVATNQELTTYIRVDQPMIALAPAAQTEPLEPVPLAVAVAVPVPPAQRLAAGPRMPATASQIASPLLIGLFCLAAALALRISRWRR